MRNCFVFLGEAPGAPALTGVQAWAVLTCQNCGTPALLLSAHKVLFPIWIMVATWSWRRNKNKRCLSCTDISVGPKGSARGSAVPLDGYLFGRVIMCNQKMELNQRPGTLPKNKINGKNSPWYLLSSLDTKQIVQSWILHAKTCSFIHLKYSSLGKGTSGLFSALSGLDLKLPRARAALQCLTLGP